METKVKAQTQTQTQTQPENLAKKLLSGEALTFDEALLLTEKRVAEEVYYLLWHYSAWGW